MLLVWVSYITHVIMILSICGNPKSVHKRCGRTHLDALCAQHLIELWLAAHMHECAHAAYCNLV